jgi:NADPH-dependent 2,4-dienoyl-CoA reductase/sulfur reductase-like enzyme
MRRLTRRRSRGVARFDDEVRIAAGGLASSMLARALAERGARLVIGERAA